MRHFLPVIAMVSSWGLVGLSACGDDATSASGSGLTCGEGTTRMANACVAEDLGCPEGTHEDNGVCVTDTPGLACGDGTQEQAGQCVPSGPVTACGEGTREESGMCLPDTVCAAGTHEEDGECVPDYPEISCADGTRQEGSQCVPDYDEIVCAEGTVEEDGECIPGYPEVVCAEGTHEDNGECVPDYPEILCAPGTHQEAGECVPDYPEITCAAGTRQEAGECVPDYPEITCGNGTEPIDGVCTVTDGGLTCGLGTVEENDQCVPAAPPIDCGYGTVLIDDECVSLTEQWVHMPFPAGSTVPLGQGFHGYFTHSGSQVYALDFTVPEGTEIAAARTGVVVRTKEDSNIGCGNGSCAADANYIVIDHGDGTYGRYWHLQQDGVMVDVGETVCRGQVIGLSGNTGFSTGAHLHFEIADTLRYTIPLRIEELRDGPGGGLPSSGDDIVSANTELTSCAPVTPSSCPTDTFAHIGVVLDPGQPCSLLQTDTTYTFTGETVYDVPFVLVGTYSLTGGAWTYSCVPTNNRRFTADVTFVGTEHGQFGHLVFGTTEQDCNPQWGWDASPWVSLQ